MKKIAVLLTVCLLALGLTALAEETPAMPGEDASVIWRGEVTTVEEKGVTLKLIEYNPENPLLPEEELPDLPEDPDDAAPGAEAPEQTPAPGSSVRGGPMDRGALSGGERPPYDRGGRSFDAYGGFPFGEDDLFPFGGDSLFPFDWDDLFPFGGGMPVSSIFIPVGEDTRYYAYRDGEFAEAALLDVRVGDTVTVRTEDGTADVVVIESGAEGSDGAPADGGHAA